MDIDKLRIKFGMQRKKKDQTIVNNLVKIPIQDKGINIPHTEIFEANNTHQVDSLRLPEDNEFNFALVCVDLDTKYIGAYQMKTASSESAKNALLWIYENSPYLDMPKRIECDPGSEFKKSFKKYFENEGVNIAYKKTGRHRQQSVVETWNGILGKYLNRRMLAEELHIGEIVGDWVDDLQDLVKLLNHITDNKIYKLRGIEKKRAAASHNGLTPTATGTATSLLPIGTNVRTILDEPRDSQGLKQHGKFRAGDIRWNMTPTTITRLSLRPNQPPMYMVGDEENVAYTKNQLQVIKANEKPVPEEAKNKFVVETILDKKKEKGLIHFLVKFKNYDATYNKWLPRKILPIQMVKEYDKNH